MPCTKSTCAACQLTAALGITIDQITGVVLAKTGTVTDVIILR